jgi:phosphoribosylformylglycinamidine synthase PurS subunit
MKVQVLVRLKAGVLDVQGKAVEQCIHELSLADLSASDAVGAQAAAPQTAAASTVAGKGEILPTDHVSQVRIGKLIELQVKTSSFEQARTLVDALCKKLLANPIIENYEIRQG